MAECAWTTRDGNIQVKVVVPPNATASVYLPGNATEPVEVGSGVHHWSYAYREPNAREALSVDSTIGEISANPRAWAVVMNSLDEQVRNNVFTVTLLSSQRKMTLRQGLEMVPNADRLVPAIADALAKLD
jgi:alpha-L-rhamnosidase